jgi:hypothetical protein
MVTCVAEEQVSRTAHLPSMTHSPVMLTFYLRYMRYSKSHIIRKTLYFYASSSDCIRALNTSPARILDHLLLPRRTSQNTEKCLYYLITQRPPKNAEIHPSIFSATNVRMTFPLERPGLGQKSVARTSKRAQL